MPSKFKPTREHKRKKLAREGQSQGPPTGQSESDPNAAVIIPNKSERETRKEALRNELRAQQPKVSAKKQKRLDKYIEKKLKKDEAADLVRKLEQERERYDASAGGLQSSKHLKRKFGDFVDGQVARNSSVAVEDGPEPHLSKKQAQKSVRHARDNDTESMDEFEEEHQDAFDPATAPAEQGPSTDDAWLKKRAPPVQGTGLAQQLQIGANGLPVIPMRSGKRRKEEQSEPQDQEAVVPEAEAAVEAEEAWEGFSDDAEQDSDLVDGQSDSDGVSSEEDGESEDEEQVDPRFKNIGSDVLDALLAELERSGESSEEGAEDEDEDDDGDELDMDNTAEVTPEEGEEASDGVSVSESASDEGSETSDSSVPSREDVRIKPRASAFKSWATQQLNQSMGHTPFYEQVQSTTNEEAEPQVYEKPAAGYRLGVKELDGPQPDRRAYTVSVQRAENIQETRSQLPILQREQEIMEAIHNNPVVVIKGDTGSGKTTQLPQFLLEAGFGDKNGPHPGMIGVTQPRRVAAVSMAKRVGEELGDHGDQVAHQIRFDTTVSAKTAIKFMTDGILLRELSQDLLLKKYSAIVIDEAHERSVNTDLLIGMLSKIVPARMRRTEQNPDPRPLKLIIMSATLNIGDFLHNKLFSDSMKPPVVEAEGRQHRVTTHFALKSRPDYVEETIEKVKRAHRKLPRGGILVFLTGQNEIKYVLSRLRVELGRSAQPVNDLPRMRVSASDTPLEMDDLDFGDFDRTTKVVDAEDDIDILTDEAEADKEFEISDDEEEPDTSTLSSNKIPLSRDPYDTVHLLPLYSQLPTKEQLRIFQPPPDRARMIVLATNVAETSLTIPNIRYVFDCGRSKERKYNTETSVQSFEIDYISKASAQQRAGRAGRTGPGHCWRLYSSAVYEQFFPDHTEPEIMRTPAESVVLQLKGFRYPRPVVDFPFPSPPSSSLLQKAEKLLRNLGAIEGQNGMLTDLGKKLSLYPLSPRLGKILVSAIEQPRILKEVLLLTAAVSVDDVFVNQAQLNNDEDDEQDSRKQAYGRAHAAFSKHDKSSDELKTLTAVQMYLDAADKESFCQQYFLRPKALSEIAQLFNQLRSMVHANHPALKLHDNKKLTSAIIADINKTTASGYIDQVALRYDLHPTPPVLLKQPTRSIDVPYLPLTPLNIRPSANTDIIDKAVFVHPSSLLSRLSTKSLPQYIVYRHLQTSQPSTVSDVSATKTRMIPLCPLDATTLLSLIRDTGLIEYGKPVPKTRVEDLPSTRPKERVCWVSTEVKSSGGSGAMGWPLPPTRVRQVMDLKSASGWRVVEVLA